ncbi:MAG: hypothetical protein WCU88_01205 [Elusimicrobiota bacterium]
MSGAAMACVLAFAAAAPAAAIDSSAGTGGANFMKLGLGSARAMALGRAYVSLAEGADALTWNPAGLALAQQKEFVYSYYRYVQEIDSPFYMGYAHPFGRTVAGANVAYMSVDGFDARDDQGRPMDSSDIRVQNGFATLSLARSFWYERLFLGVSAKGVHEDNAGSARSSVVGDAGLLLRPAQGWTLGASVQNIGAGTAKVASVTRVGASGRILELLTLTGEISKASDNSARLGAGAEFTLPEDLLQIGQVQLRAGFYNADDMGQVMEKDRSFMYPLIGSPRWSFGIGLYTAQAFGYGIAFDYSLVSMGALGTADMLSLKVKF